MPICLKSRSPSMWTPNSLKSSNLSMGRPSRLSTASLVSPSIFLGLIFRSWNFSGLADKRLIEYHIRAYLQLVFSAVQLFRDLFPSNAIDGHSRTWLCFHSRHAAVDHSGTCSIVRAQRWSSQTSTFHRFPNACNFTPFYSVSSVLQKRSHQVERSTSKAISLQLLYCQRVTQTVEGLILISVDRT